MVASIVRTQSPLNFLLNQVLMDVRRPGSSRNGCVKLRVKMIVSVALHTCRRLHKSLSKSRLMSKHREACPTSLVLFFSFAIVLWMNSCAISRLAALNMYIYPVRNLSRGLWFIAVTHLLHKSVVPRLVGFPPSSSFVSKYRIQADRKLSEHLFADLDVMEYDAG
jgi:hypothetical protein